MTQFILENPDKLIKFINNIDTIQSNFNAVLDSINVQLKTINPERSNNLILYTMLPLVIIEIINSYVNDEINLCVEQNRIEYYTDLIQYSLSNVTSIPYKYYKFSANNSYIDNNTYSFQFAQYITNVARSNDCFHQNMSRKSSLHICFTDNNIFEYKNILRLNPFKIKKKRKNALGKHWDLHLNTKHKKTHNEYKRRKSHLKTISNDFDKYFANRKSVLDCYFVRNKIDLIQFFNCFSANTQHQHNIIESESRSNKDKILVIEKCKYDNELKYYNYVSLGYSTIKMAQYKINNHEMMTNVISIIKLLYDTIFIGLK